jgi:hypothetical protein
MMTSQFKFPVYLNPKAQSIWEESCLGLDEKATLDLALVKFTDLCFKNNLYPFRAGQGNGAIRYFLFKKRLRLVTFFNLSKILQGLKVIRKVRHQVRPTSQGFEIEVSTQVLIHDPTLIHHLQNLPLGNRFSLLRRGKKYITNFDKNIVVYIYNDHINVKSAWHIGYIIKCPLIPDYPNKDKANFIFNQLWKPLISRLRAVKTDQLRPI